MTKVSDKLLINLACTGLIPTKAMTPHVPVTHDEICLQAESAISAGVQMLHLHTRDSNGGHNAEPGPYGRLIRDIRALPGGKESVLVVTTSGRHHPDFDTRSAVLDLEDDEKPDMASLTLSSLNFVSGASVNAPDVIRALATRMREKGIKPELEVFDLGMANFVNVLVKENLVDLPVYVNVILGNISGAQTDPLHFSAIMAALPDNAIVSIGGIGRAQLAANGLGLLFADGVRVGLEDNIWFDQDRNELATNDAFIKRIVQQAKLFERPLMSAMELRHKLALTVKAVPVTETKTAFSSSYL